MNVKVNNSPGFWKFRYWSDTLLESEKLNKIFHCLESKEPVLSITIMSTMAYHNVLYILVEHTC